jgi:predicted transposase YdaD
MINKAAGLVMELNEDEAERMRADSRLYFLMDQEGFRREGEAKGKAEGLEEGRKEAEAKYRPILEAKDRENEQLRQKLREAGIES